MNTTQTKTRGRLQTLTGKVIQNKLDKTITVEVMRKYQHKIYEKVISSSKKYLVDDQHNVAQINDLVTIVATRPLSARKRFRLLKVVAPAVEKKIKTPKKEIKNDDSAGNQT